jgi:phospholipid/cholesterol/gamma-HCH transport system substrate-binding protein
MEAEARYTYVGIGVLALVAALVFGVVWLKSSGGKGEFARYAIHFERQALDGLEVGGDVRLRGIKIGRVQDYALVGGKLNRVRVEVRVDRRAPVRTNTTAVVTRNFVTGIAAITLVTAEPPGEALEEVPEGETYPVIAEGRSDIDELAGRVNQLGDMAALTLAELNQLFNADNRQAVMTTVRNLGDLSDGLNKRLTALDTTLARVSQAALQFGNAAGQLGQAGERIAGVADRSGERLDRTLAEAERALVEAQRAMQQVAQASGVVQQQTVATARRLEDSASRVDDHLSAALVELQLTMETATRALDALREPRAALLGPSTRQLGPGERLP